MLKAEYIAGFFDGEGSIGIYTTGKSRLHLRTQVTQNANHLTGHIINSLVNRYGGSANIYQSLSKNPYYSWQLNGKKARDFLEDIVEHLHIKKEQAVLAIVWENARLPFKRDSNGRILATVVTELDYKVAQVMKDLKSTNTAIVMKAQEDLVEIVHTVKQVLCVKG